MIHVIASCILLSVVSVLYSSQMLNDRVSLPNQIELKTRINKVFLSDGETSCQIDALTPFKLIDQNDQCKVRDVLTFITVLLAQYELKIIQSTPGSHVAEHPEKASLKINFVWNKKKPLIEAVLQDYPKIKELVRDMENMGAFASATTKQ